MFDKKKQFIPYYKIIGFFYIQRFIHKRVLKLDTKYSNSNVGGTYVYDNYPNKYIIKGIPILVICTTYTNMTYPNGQKTHQT